MYLISDMKFIGTVHTKMTYVCVMIVPYYAVSV